MPAAFDGTHPAGGPAPALGENTADVLARHLGFTTDDIARLTSAKTIAC